MSCGGEGLPGRPQTSSCGVLTPMCLAGAGTEQQGRRQSAVEIAGICIPGVPRCSGLPLEGPPRLGEKPKPSEFPVLPKATLSLYLPLM